MRILTGKSYRPKSDGDGIRNGDGSTSPLSRNKSRQIPNYAHRLLLVTQSFTRSGCFVRVEHGELPSRLDDALNYDIDWNLLPLCGPWIAQALLDGLPQG